LEEARAQPDQASDQVDQGEGLVLPEALVKTIQHFAPDFLPALARVKDPRNPDLIDYAIEHLLLVGILSFMVKAGARRNIKYLLGTRDFIENLKEIGGILYPETFFPDTLPHGDTLNYLLERVAVSRIEDLRTLVMRALLRGRCLEKFRLLDTYYLIAVDGTGCLTFTERHCPHCLKKTKDGKILYYYHPVLEAKLVTSNGMAFSIATEFIENEAEDVAKQDCEQKAFHRLAKRIKSDFPQLKICLLLDSLYMGEPIFKACADNRWAHMITFKEGSMSAVFKEYETLKGLAPENHLNARDLSVRRKERRQTFFWINEVPTDAERNLNVLECTDITAGEKRRFVWATNIPIDANRVVEIANEGGRLRWKIENEGFNRQKNGGYGLEHAFSMDNTAMKSFYVLLQIAHIFDQLMEKGNLLRERIQETMGSLKVFSRMLWAELTHSVVNPDRLRALLARRIQIRFDTG